MKPEQLVKTLRRRYTKKTNHGTFMHIDNSHLGDVGEDIKMLLNELDKALIKINKFEGNMKEGTLDKMIKEVSAEIVGDKIPARKVFNDKGNIIPLDQIKGSESQGLLKAIKASLVKTGLIKNFSPENLSNIDIKPHRTVANTYILTADIGGKKYLYNVKTGQIRET